MKFDDLDYQQRVILAANEIIQEEYPNHLSMKCVYNGGDLLLTFSLINREISRELPAIRVDLTRIYGNDVNIISRLEGEIAKMRNIL